MRSAPRSNNPRRTVSLTCGRVSRKERYETHKSTDAGNAATDRSYTRPAAPPSLSPISRAKPTSSSAYLIQYPKSNTNRSKNRSYVARVVSFIALYTCGNSFCCAAAEVYLAWIWREAADCRRSVVSMRVSQSSRLSGSAFTASLAFCHSGSSRGKTSRSVSIVLQLLLFLCLVDGNFAMGVVFFG